MLRQVPLNDLEPTGSGIDRSLSATSRQSLAAAIGWAKLAPMSRHFPRIGLVLLLASGLATAQTATSMRLTARSTAQAPLKATRMGSSADVSSDDDTNCPAEGPQSELVQCIATEGAALEAQINQYFRAGLDAIDHNEEVTKNERAEGHREFIAAQTSWVSFRNHPCSAWYQMSGGTSAKLDAVACREKTDRRRIRELLEFPGIRQRAGCRVCRWVVPSCSTPRVH